MAGNAKISERTQPVRYQATLLRAALRASLTHNAADATFDQAAAGAGLRPPQLMTTREAVRYCLENPVDFMADCSQDVTFAVFEAAEKSRPLVVIGANGRASVMTPEPVEDSA